MLTTMYGFVAVLSGSVASIVWSESVTVPALRLTSSSSSQFRLNTIRLMSRSKAHAQRRIDERPARNAERERDPDRARHPLPPIASRSACA